MKLEEFFDAYDRTHEISGREVKWQDLRKKVRRALLRPVLELAGQGAFVIGALLFGIFGHPVGYFLAVGGLCFIPQYVHGVRKELATVSSLSTHEGLRQHLDREAGTRVAGAFLSALFWAGSAVLFLVVGGIAGLVGKDFVPGLCAALIAGGLAGYKICFSYRRARREALTLRENITGEEDGHDEEAEDGK